MKLAIDQNDCVIVSHKVTECEMHKGTDSPLTIGTAEQPTSLIVNSNIRILEGYGALLESDGDNCPQIRTHTCRDSINNPKALEKGDYVTHFIALGHTGKEYETVAGFRVDVAGEVTEDSIPGVFTVSVGNYMNNKSAIQNFDFDYSGQFTSPKIKAKKSFSPPVFQNFSDLENLDLEEGNIIYLKDEKSFYGCDGETWFKFSR